MKQITLTALVALSLALPAAAQTPAPNPDAEISEGFEQLSEGLRRLLGGLLGKADEAGDEIGQGWARLIEQLGDLSEYEAPEILPNGDILIRRKPEAEGKGAEI